jgi:fluoroquinolone resistance protein
MTDRPDVVDEYLEPWEPVPLGGGFVIEDALVREADFGGVAAAGGAVKRSRLAGVKFAGTRMRSLRLVDVIVSDADLSNADWGAAELSRVVFERCRMTGFGGAELKAENVVFRECALELSNLRGVALRGVTFEDCGLDDADFGSAVLREVRFERSHLRRVLIDGLRLTRVDFRGSRLEPDGDVSALRGAIIDSLQLVELGPLLAAGLGISVR